METGFGLTSSAPEAEALQPVYDALQAAFGGEEADMPFSAMALLLRWAQYLSKERCMNEKALQKKAAMLASLNTSKIFRAELLRVLDLVPREDGSPAWHSHLFRIPFRQPTGSGAYTGNLNPGSTARAAWPHRSANLLPFSSSCKYSDTRRFYADQGSDAWRHEVPSGVTTNAFIAQAYAKTIHAHMVGDLLPRHGDGCVVYIIELAAGHAQLAYLLCRALMDLLDMHGGNSAENGPRGIRFKYIVTDFNQSLLEDRSRLPWLQPLLHAGLMDFAVLDAEDPCSTPRDLSSEFSTLSATSPPAPRMEDGRGMTLLWSGEVIRPGSLAHPMVLVGNYALDTMPQDVFFRLPDEEGRMVVKELVWEATMGELLLEPLDLASMDARTYQQHDLLLRMLERGPGLHFVPVGFMHALQRLEALLRRPTTATHPRDVALLLGDGTFQWDDEHWVNELHTFDIAPRDSSNPTAGRPYSTSPCKDQADLNRQQPKKVGPFIPLPDMSPSVRCFAMAVDFETIAHAAAAILLPGLAPDRFTAVRSTDVDGSLTVAWMTTHRPEKPPSASVSEFGRSLCLQQPSDFELIQGLAEETVRAEVLIRRGQVDTLRFVTRLDASGVMGLLAWSCGDFDLFCTLRWRLRDLLDREAQEPGACPEHCASLRRAAIAMGLRCARHRIALSISAWLRYRYRFMQWLYAMGAYVHVLEALLHDAGQCGANIDVEAKVDVGVLAEFVGFASAAEAFLVGRALERQGEHDLAWKVYINAGASVYISKHGRERLYGRLEKGPGPFMAVEGASENTATPMEGEGPQSTDI